MARTKRNKYRIPFYYKLAADTCADDEYQEGVAFDEERDQHPEEQRREQREKRITKERRRYREFKYTIY